MIINIGSKNTNKINATKRAISNYTEWKCEYKTMDVSSNVSEEPRSLNETMDGAINGSYEKPSTSKNMI